MGRYDNLDADDIQQIMSYEHAPPNTAHSLAWHRLTQILDQHRDNLRVYAERLAAHWDPATNVAAAAFLSHIEELRAALDASAQVTMTNSNALTDLAGHITTTQKQVTKIAKDYGHHKSEDKELINNLNPWYDDQAPKDNAHARAALEKFDQASFDTYMRMQLPPEYIPPTPGEFDPNEPGADSGWQPLSPIAPLVTPVPGHPGPITGPVTQPWPAQPAPGYPAGGGPIVAGGGPIIQGGGPVPITPAPVTPGPHLPTGPGPTGPGLPGLPGLPPTTGLPVGPHAPSGGPPGGSRRPGLLDNLPNRRSVSPVVGGTGEAAPARQPLRSRPPGTVPSMLGETTRPAAPAQSVAPGERGLSARPNRGGVIGSPSGTGVPPTGRGPLRGVDGDEDHRYSDVYEEDFWGNRQSAPAVITGPGDPRPVEPGPTRPAPPVERPIGVSPVIGSPGPNHPVASGPAIGGPDSRLAMPSGPAVNGHGSDGSTTAGAVHGSSRSEHPVVGPTSSEDASSVPVRSTHSLTPFNSAGRLPESPGATDPGPTIGLSRGSTVHGDAG
ncbi:hypothetical protein AB0M43_15315 [Longispora sp. NPDC051575]|uniref:hypothetical protein n=1 Tax=Longispora sp. NPDC051575 TaxID=3154943 RepID=UPI003445D0B2